MDPVTAGLISVVVMLALMVLGVHIATVLAGCALAGLLLTSGWPITSSLIANSLYASVSDYSLVLIPLYIIMGSIAAHSGIIEDSMKFAQRWLGGFRGSLAMTSVLSCAFFSAVCGSSTATSVAIGKFMIPEMRKYGYSDRLSTGAIASAGTLGVLIPPSLVMVVFCVMTGTPVSMMFLAGIIPGILLTLFFMIGIRIYVQFRPDAAPPPERSSLGEKVRTLPKIWGVALLIGVIWGGIYGGIFTATEAGAVAVLLAFVLLIFRRSLSTGWSKLMEAVPDAVQATGMIFITMVAATLFSKYLTVLGVFDGLIGGITSAGVPPIVTVFMIFAIILVMGMFMVAMAVLLITAPIATTILTSLGYDPLWVGIMMILLFELANITPPVGLNTYVVKGIAPEVPMEDIFSGSFIFIVMIVAMMALLMIFPGIVTWLPNTLR